MRVGSLSEGLDRADKWYIEEISAFYTNARTLTQKDVFKYAAKLNNMYRISLNERTACPNLRLI